MSLRIKDCVKHIHRFCDADKEIITLMSLLESNRGLKRRKMVYGSDIILEYENGEVVKINHEILVSVLQKDNDFKEVLDLLNKVTEKTE
jgi:hypothetical protein